VDKMSVECNSKKNPASRGIGNILWVITLMSTKKEKEGEKHVLGLGQRKTVAVAAV
jgi:hypothetical protein